MSTVTGIGGGIIRDLVLGNAPPLSFTMPHYVLVTLSTGLILFFLYPRLKNKMKLFLVFDALGLGIFTVIGGNFAFQLFGLDFMIIVLAGVLTGVGGGIIRDVLVREIPIILIKELYATASFLGILSFFSILYLLDNLIMATIIGFSISTGFRLLSMKWKWNLPSAREK